MRTRLKILAATLGALIMLSGIGYDVLLWNQGAHQPKPPPEVVPPWACPKEGALFQLRGYNIITLTFYEAIELRFQSATPRIADEKFADTMREVLQDFDGRLLEVFNLAFAGELPTSYFNALLDERRIGALVDVLRPCPDDPFLPDAGEMPLSEWYPQTGARLIPYSAPTRLPDPYFIPVTFDFSGLN